MSLWMRNLLLALLVVALVGLPLLFLQGAEWGGTDSLGTDAIAEVSPDYQPWFEPFFSAADAGIERYMFGLQALLGSLALSAGMGWLIGRYRGSHGGGERDQTTALTVCAVAVVIAIGLFFVDSEFGEIQGFISGLQGLLIGFLGYFLGYPSGKRYGASTAEAGAGAPMPPVAEVPPPR